MSTNFPSQLSPNERPEPGMSPDYYETLNVPYGASKSLIREAYIRLKNTFSAQSNAFYSLISDHEAQQMMAKIEEAFRVLNDDIRRREYDRSLGFDNEFMRPNESSPFEPDLREGLEDRNVFHPRPAMSSTLSIDSSFTGNTGRAVPAGVGLPVKRKTDDEVKERIRQLSGELGAGSGVLYQQIRELIGVTVEEMQARTKIGIDYIKAIESENFSYLPQTVFVKGFLRSYLRYLAVPEPEGFVQAFAARYEQWQQENDPTT